MTQLADREVSSLGFETTGAAELGQLNRAGKVSSRMTDAHTIHRVRGHIGHTGTKRLHVDGTNILTAWGPPLVLGIGLPPFQGQSRVEAQRFLGRILHSSSLRHGYNVRS